jgi:hypothetical protein
MSRGSLLDCELDRGTSKQVIDWGKLVSDDLQDQCKSLYPVEWMNTNRCCED